MQPDTTKPNPRPHPEHAPPLHEGDPPSLPPKDLTDVATEKIPGRQHPKRP